MRTSLAIAIAVSLAVAACQRGHPPPTAGNAGAQAPPPAHAGAGFVAMGQEPGWRADVSPGQPPRLTASLDYGNRRIEVAAAVAADAGWTGPTADGTPVTLSFARKPCQDSMSGEPFAAEATLTVADQTWRGCGRFTPD